MANELNRYQRIIERIFLAKYSPGLHEFTFQRDEFEATAHELCITLPKNVSDILYSFRFRTPLPASVQSTAPADMRWIIELAGHGLYRFTLKAESLIDILPNPLIAETKIPDATPGVVAKYALSDEQALLAKVRYNRLIDIFLGVACYSLQNHLRTTVPGIGQIETDEIYIGVDRRGAQYIIPVQAKGGKDKISIVQIEQDIALSQHKYPSLVCRPVAAQFMKGDVIALFEFEIQQKHVAISAEKHYRLVSPDEISEEELSAYRRRQVD